MAPRFDSSDVDFESLPPALRRKYFSSLERLRLAQDGLSPSFNSCQRAPSRQSLRPRKYSRNFSNELDRRLSLITTYPRKRLQKRRSVSKSTLFTPVTATLFASLPPAIRRKHFSRDEQDFFSPRKRSVILDAADETFYKCSQRETNRNPPRLYTAFQDDPESLYFPYPSADSEQISSMDMADYTIDGLSWLEDNQELDLRLDDYHSAIAETARRQAALTNKQSFRRRVSLSNLSLHRHSGSSSQPAAQLSPSTASSFQVKLNPSSASSSRQHQTRPSSSSIDPCAAHYQDPAARMKLRVYLASPQKFDEAVEFGFPSLQEVRRLKSDRPTTSPRLAYESSRTFFTTETPSLSGDEDEERDEFELNDPRTPEDPVFQSNRSPTFQSKDRYGIVKVQPARVVTDSYPQAATADREMTLHMTLTRPDLRSPDEIASSDLPPNSKLTSEAADATPVEQPATIWDTLPLEESKVKKLWRKLKLK